MPGATKFDETHEVDKLRIQALYRQSVTAQTVGLINVIIAIVVLRDMVPQNQLLLWGAAWMVIYTSRIALQKIFSEKNAHPNAEFDPHSWETAFAIGNFVAGSAWGFAAVVMIPANSLASQAFIAFLLAGTTAGAAVVYTLSMASIFAFLLPAVVPFAIRLSLEAAQIQSAMAMLLLLYVLVVGLSMRGLNRTIVGSIRIRFVQGRLLRELKQAQDSLIQSAKMSALGEMAASIAHEINNPLSIIHFHATNLKESGLPAPAVELVEKIDATSSRIARIVSGLRAFARGDALDELQSVPLENVINETLELCRIRQKKHRILLLVDNVPKDAFLRCRPTQIAQILLNLLNNAFDAVENVGEPWVGVEIKVTAETITIAVADNGGGIPAEIRERIMQPFFTTKEVGKGTGLGLSIAHGIASAHGGKLQLDSSEQTRFVLTLPRFYPGAAAAERLIG